MSYVGQTAAIAIREIQANLGNKKKIKADYIFIDYSVKVRGSIKLINTEKYYHDYTREISTSESCTLQAPSS